MLAGQLEQRFTLSSVIPGVDRLDPIQPRLLELSEEQAKPG